MLRQRNNVEEALFTEVHKGRIHIIKRIINTAPANLPINYDDLLSEAAYRDNVEMVKLFLEKGANIHANNDDAFRRGKTLKMKICLLENGGGNFEEDYRNLVLAVCQGNTEKVIQLVENGGDVRRHNDLLFLYAVNFRFHDIVKYLISKGAYVRVNDGEAIITASRFSDIRMVKILVKNGAKISAQGYKSVYQAIYSKHDADKIIKYFIKKDLNVFHVNNNSIIFLSTSIKNGYYLLKLLFAKNKHYSVFAGSVFWSDLFNSDSFRHIKYIFKKRAFIYYDHYNEQCKLDAIQKTTNKRIHLLSRKGFLIKQKQPFYVIK